MDNKSLLEIAIVKEKQVYAFSGYYAEKVDHEKLQLLIDDYSAALEAFAQKNNYYYIKPNSYLREYFENHDYRTYMIDAIHPNSTTGVTLYSKAIFECSK